METTDTIEAAKLAYELNAAYCRSIGDNSQPDWDDAPQWQRDSVIAGAKAIKDNPGITPEQSHEGWLVQKEADGWVYGDVKDPEKKEHPCMVPYDKLPLNQQAKDHIFSAAVRFKLGL